MAKLEVKFLDLYEYQKPLILIEKWNILTQHVVAK